VVQGAWGHFILVSYLGQDVHVACAAIVVKLLRGSQAPGGVF
jgi:hypothetical protein